ncbi:hypothetical protein Prudu_010105 [Prunus dulcis]|uniref:Uncharacterized protein n=1 Tax=Prunus dulcis TaxID=3755 RepID=A0A4Y1R7M4_PRUDU|nr:hypothetical protein Prudu_010105 [Prunus dulcis]
MDVVVELQMDKISQQLLLTLTLAPSGFHIEILLMSFHLSSEEEKALHAKLIFSVRRTIGGPTSFDFSASPYEILPTDLSFVFACTPTIHEGHSVLHFTARGERSFVILSLNCISKCNDWITVVILTDYARVGMTSVQPCQAVVVEDLVIERYIFVPCWDFPTIGTARTISFL